MDALSDPQYAVGVMSGLAVLLLLWAGAGIVLALGSLRGPEPAPAPDAARFGRVAEDRSANRLHAMRLAYGVGAACCAVGAVAGLDVVLAFGASLLNLGTVYRYLVVAMDHTTVDAPVLVLPERSVSRRFLLGDVLDQPAT